jgi:hypothetical protein
MTDTRRPLAEFATRASRAAMKLASAGLHRNSSPSAEGYMMCQLERDVRRALETFVGEIVRAAERAAIEAIRASFAQVSSRLGTVANSGGDVPSPGESAHKRVPISPDVALTLNVVTRIRENPGCSTVQLGRSLGIHSAKLRRYLRKLAIDGAIRIEESRSKFGGQRCYTYFVVEHINGQCAEPVIPAEATA